MMKDPDEGIQPVSASATIQPDSPGDCIQPIAI